MNAPGAAQVFLERMLQLLARGSFSSTYKYAVLLGLIDLCVEHGSPPQILTVDQLARRVIALYWPHARAFSHPKEGSVVLSQNSGGQATILSRLTRFQKDHFPDARTPRLPRLPERAPLQDADLPLLAPERAAAILLREVAWVLVSYPLPRLQRIGGGEERFIYEIGWGEDVSRAAFLRGQIDNRLMLCPGAGEQLLALAPVLRPLIQQRWAARVRALNRLDGDGLEPFLFGAERGDLAPLRPGLRDLQAGRCFYCAAELREPGEIDHFLPFSRYPDDGLDNLVLAHRRCNRDKLDFLADLGCAERWRLRTVCQGADLDAICGRIGHDRDPRRTLGAVAGAYRGLPEGVRLWGPGGLRRLEGEGLRAVRRFAEGLL